MSVRRVAAVWWLGGLLVVLGVGTGVAVNLAGSSSGSGSGSASTGASDPNGNGGSSHPIVLTGTVSGRAVPGLPVTLSVTIDNSKNAAINVRSVTAQLTSVTSAGLPDRLACQLDWFTLGSFSGSKTIPKGSVGNVQLPLLLRDLPSTNQDNCKDVTYSFTFAATADQA